MAFSNGDFSNLGASEYSRDHRVNALQRPYVFPFGLLASDGGFCVLRLWLFQILNFLTGAAEAGGVCSFLLPASGFVCFSTVAVMFSDFCLVVFRHWSLFLTPRRCFSTAASMFSTLFAEFSVAL